MKEQKGADRCRFPFWKYKRAGICNENLRGQEIKTDL